MQCVKSRGRDDFWLSEQVARDRGAGLMSGAGGGCQPHGNSLPGVAPLRERKNGSARGIEFTEYSALDVPARIYPLRVVPETIAGRGLPLGYGCGGGR